MAGYCTQADVEIAAGGAAILAQLLDKDGDGIADAAMVDACIRRAAADIKSRIQVELNLSSIEATSPYPDSLIYANAGGAVYYAWLTGTGGQASTVDGTAYYNAMIAWCSDVREKRVTLGSLTPGTPRQFVESVDRNPVAPGTTPTPTWLSMRGSFW